MRSLQWHNSENKEFSGNDDYQLALVFGHPDDLNDDLFLDLSTRMPSACVIGCTAGNFFHNGESFESGYSVNCLDWDGHTHAETIDLDSERSATDIAAGLLAHGKPEGAIILWREKSDTSEAFLHELQSALGADCSIFGGFAADADFQFKNMAVYSNGSKASAVVVGLYGEKIRLNSAHATGLAWLGRTREITKTKGCAVLEIDGEPAAEVLARLGVDMSRKPEARGLSSLQMVTEFGEPGLVRTPLYIDEETSALICGAPVPEGTARFLSFTDHEAILESASTASASAIKDQSEGGFCLVVNCAARYKMLGPIWELELDHVDEALQPGITYAGFYAYGEVAPLNATGRSELHSQTIPYKGLLPKP